MHNWICKPASLLSSMHHYYFMLLLWRVHKHVQDIDKAWQTYRSTKRKWKLLPPSVIYLIYYFMLLLAIYHQHLLLWKPLRTYRQRWGIHHQADKVETQWTLCELSDLLRLFYPVWGQQKGWKAWFHLRVSWSGTRVSWPWSGTKILNATDGEIWLPEVESSRFTIWNIAAQEVPSPNNRSSQ